MVLTLKKINESVFSIIWQNSPTRNYKYRRISGSTRMPCRCEVFSYVERDRLYTGSQKKEKSKAKVSRLGQYLKYRRERDDFSFFRTIAVMVYVMFGFSAARLPGYR